MNKNLDSSTFQGLIFALQQFWADQGCVIMQPLDMEVGAGTFHPATFLRAIGPETWNTAYVQPCRRPTDGRYGENPNLLQHYYQFQVLLKPSPKNIQELYLDSLRSLGIDMSIHDIRFVEDNWESPTLGAWGLGWEVWLNGMEVTQFTYFQQVGGLECYPVSGEITYGIERIAMYLQGVDSIYDIVWADGPDGVVTYGDVFKQNPNLMKQFEAATANTMAQSGNDQTGMSSMFSNMFGGGGGNPGMMSGVNQVPQQNLKMNGPSNMDDILKNLGNEERLETMSTATPSEISEMTETNSIRHLLGSKKRGNKNVNTLNI